MRYLSLTFNNKDICSWLALLFSILKSGFTFDRMYFQDGVKNYRQTAHTKAKGSPYGDFIYTFKKVDSIPVKVYTTEEDFIYDIDNIFLKDISCSDENRNEMILQMFVDAIPLIDAFAKTYLRTRVFIIYTPISIKNIYQSFTIQIMRTSESKTIINQELFDVKLPDYQRIIERLVSKYNVVDGSYYEGLVNFKTNLVVPKHNGMIINKAIQNYLSNISSTKPSH